MEFGNRALGFRNSGHVIYYDSWLGDNKYISKSQANVELTPLARSTSIIEPVFILIVDSVRRHENKKTIMHIKTLFTINHLNSTTQTNTAKVIFCCTSQNHLDILTQSSPSLVPVPPKSRQR